jgi:hypothetical protein
MLTPEEAEAAEKLGAALGIDTTKTVDEVAAQIEQAAARYGYLCYSSGAAAIEQAGQASAPDSLRGAAGRQKTDRSGPQLAADVLYFIWSV